MQWAAVSRVAESHQITAAHVQIHAGDLARWLENGSIQIMGRVDRQVQPNSTFFCDSASQHASVQQLWDEYCHTLAPDLWRLHAGALIHL